MKDQEKIEKLKRILSEQIRWYLDKKEEGKDDDYVYDELYEIFNWLTRSDFVDIIKTLLSK